MPPIVLITRPEPEASLTAAHLAELAGGLVAELEVVISPLTRIDILPGLPPPAPGTRLIFTSRNGVRAWVEGGGTAEFAYCVGDATARAAQEAGLQTRSAAGDAQDLLALIRAEAPDAPLLHLHGRHHRGDLCGQLRTAGLDARGVVAYDQREQGFGPAALAAMDSGRPIVAPLYSPRSARLFADGWRGRGPLAVAAISPAAAAPINSLETFRLSIAPRPGGRQMEEATVGLIAAMLQLEAGQGGD